jgi:hypothetical protein
LQGSDSLLTLAEIALGFAGFTAVVATFTRTPGRWPPVERFRLLVLLLSSLGVLFLALLPLAIAYLGATDASALRLSSGVMAGFTLVGWAPILRAHAALKVHSPDLSAPRLFLSANVGSVANVTAQLLNSLAVIGPSFGVYFCGLLWLLLVAALQFGRIVFAHPQGE